MSVVKTIQIKCTSCKTWFNSPIFLGDMNTFDVSTLKGNRVDCPSCGKMVDCNKSNMRVVSDDGGFRGLDT